MRKTVYSSVRPSLKQKLLRRGTVLGVLGAGILLGFSTWGSESLLNDWGLPIFCTGIASIAVGMIPLRKIQRIENVPHKLSITARELIFEKPGRDPLSLHREDILSTQFMNRGDLYGIEVITRTLQTFFFAYFSEDSANTVAEYVMHPQESDE